MTKFVADSKRVAAGRNSSSSMSSKERKKNMDAFKETGQHPHIQATAEDVKTTALVPLPPVDLNRAHVFLDLKQGSRKFPRVVLELFDDRFPVATTSFKNRCLEGQNTLKGTRIHKLLPSFAIFGGKADRQADHTVLAAANAGSRLQHVEAGVLSVSRDGQEFAISLGRALQLDHDNLVIGRMVSAAAFVEKMNAIETDPEDAPAQSLLIAQCGTTDHKGTFETLSEATGPQTGAEATASMGRDLEGSRANLASALQQGLKRQGPPKAKQPAGKRRMLDVALPDESSDDSEEDVT